MYSQIIGTQQILVTAVFLGVMLVVLIILRRKGGAIRASLKAGKRISVIEDTAVSPTERLRLISVDDSEFLMLSAKGQAPVLMPFTLTSTVSAKAANRGAASPSMGLADIDELDQVSSTQPEGTNWWRHAYIHHQLNVPPLSKNFKAGDAIMRQASLFWQGALGWGWLVLVFAGVCLDGRGASLCTRYSASDDEWSCRWTACAGGE